MSSITQLHDRAMEYAANATVSEFNRDSASALKNSRRAFLLEREAAKTSEKHPKASNDDYLTSAILYRSAAWLAIDCNERAEAVLLAQRGLALTGNTQLREELQEVLTQAQLPTLPET